MRIPLRGLLLLVGLLPVVAIDSTYAAEQFVLVVNSPYGAPTPASGITMFDESEVVTAFVPDSPIINGGSRQSVTGWIGTGDVPSAGTTTNTNPFMMSQDSSITWLWQMAYWLELTMDGNGSADTTSGWVDGESIINITALADEGYHFVKWTGDLGTADPSNNVLSVTMDQARNITANFSINIYTISATAPSNVSISPSGTVSLAHGGSALFTMTPTESYPIDNVLVDGLSVGAVSHYLFTNVTQNHTLEAFASSPLTVQFAVPESMGSESLNPAQINLRLNGIYHSPVSAMVSLVGGNAIGGGQDYTWTNQSVIIPAGQQCVPFDVHVNDDMELEATESMIFELSNPNPGGLGSVTQHTYLILDNEKPPTIAFSISTSSGLESFAPVLAELSLSETSQVPVRVDVRVTGGTASGPEDHSFASQTVTFAPGTKQASVSFIIVNDTTAELSEDLVLSLVNPVDGILDTNKTFTYTIIDDDTASDLSLTQTSNPVGPLIPGQVVTYSLTPSAALLHNLVVVQNPVPADMSYVPSSATAGGSEVDEGLTWNLGSHTSPQPGFRNSSVLCPTYLRLQAVEDTYIEEDSVQQTHGSEGKLITVSAIGSKHHALIRFDLTALPPGARIDSAVLRLTGKGPTTEQMLYVKKLTTPWNQVDASWERPSAGTTWAAGLFSSADYDPSLITPFVRGASKASTQADITPLAQAWHTESNHGLLLFAAGNSKDAAQWQSVESSQAPVLDLVYTEVTDSDCRSVHDFRTIADTTIREDKPSKTYGSSLRLLSSSDRGAQRMTLMKFDLTTIPSNATIHAAELGVRVQRKLRNQSNFIHRVLTPWQEVDATWESPDGSSPWLDGSFGVADYDRSILGTFTPDLAETVETVDLTSLVESWVNQGTRNEGITIRSSDSTSGTSSCHSREDSTAAFRPYLRVDWSPKRGVSSRADLLTTPSLAGDGDLVTITSRLRSEAALLNAVPDSTLAVTGIDGASATYVSGPFPASADVGPSGAEFTYVYKLSAGDVPGSVTFSGSARSADHQFETATSSSVIVSPTLSFQAAVHSPLPDTSRNLVNTSFMSSLAQSIPFSVATTNPVASVTYTVLSPFGDPYPSPGTYTANHSAVMQFELFGSPKLNGSTQVVATGWTGTGDVTPTGTSTNTGELSITQDSSITWTWKTLYRLDTTLFGNGSLDVDDGWFDQGTNLTMTARAAFGHHFVTWAGDIGAADPSNPVLSVTMDQAKTIIASFEVDTFTINSSVIGRGLILPETVVVPMGQSTSVTVQASSDHRIADILVNANSIGTFGPGDSLYLHTFTNVTEDQSIEAIFTPELGSLQVFLEPRAARWSGAQWRLVSGPDTEWYPSGSAVSNIPAGVHTVTFADADDFDTPADMTVRLTGSSQSTITAQFGTAGLSLVPAQTFSMGIENGIGGREVDLDSFLISQREVTVEEFQAYADATGIPMPPQPTADPDLPVVSISWNHVIGYINWLNNEHDLEATYSYVDERWVMNRLAQGYRLPTEAEWECAARGALVDNLYPWGNTITTNDANYRLKILARTKAGHYLPNGYGLFDVGGNVWEWTHDWYSLIYGEPASNPEGPDTGSQRVIRGGSWASFESMLKNANRTGADPDTSGSDVGFRVVQSVTELDTDGDGMPDWWEFDKLGHPTTPLPEEDPDGDGVNNLTEYYHCIDPRYPNPPREFIDMDVDQTTGSVMMEWPSDVGLTYWLEWTDDIKADTWTLLQGNIPATPPMNTHIEPSANEAVRFYRLGGPPCR